MALREDGYDAAARQLSPARRLKVISRDGGCCVLCAASGAEIDHIDGPSAELDNLRYLCSSCHQGITRSHMRPITSFDEFALAVDLSERVYVKEPLHPQDRADWTGLWRSWVRDHAEYAPAGEPAAVGLPLPDQSDEQRSVVAQRTVITLTDDIDGTPAHETVTFGLDGASYEIDLNKEHAADLQGVLGPYVDAARRLGRPSAAHPARAAVQSKRALAADIDPKVVRAWATEQGLTVSARGRIKAEILEQYRASKHA